MKEEPHRLRLTWAQFEKYARDAIRKDYPKMMEDVVKLGYIKTYNCEPEGEMYDFPDYVDIYLQH